MIEHEPWEKCEKCKIEHLQEENKKLQEKIEELKQALWDSEFEDGKVELAG
jgi:chaperonin cofactor prefoldin